jgi:hypothetical protein
LYSWLVSCFSFDWGKFYLWFHSKWGIAMCFSMGSNLGFIIPGMNAVNKFLGSKMLYTRSIALMSRQLLILMHQLEH